MCGWMWAYPLGERGLGDRARVILELALDGHFHGELEPVGKPWDVGVDNDGYTPVSFDRIRETGLEENSRPAKYGLKFSENLPITQWGTPSTRRSAS